MSYPKKGLTIEVGNEKIKVIQYQRNKNRAKIEKTILLNTPDRAIEDGNLIEVESLAELIKEGLKANGIKTKSCVFTIASSKIITREVDLPDLPAKKLDALIHMNASEYFPVNLADYTIDYRIVEHLQGEEKQVHVNIVAIMTSQVEGYLRLSKLAGLNIVGIDYTGNSIVNYAMALGFEGTYMLLDFGSNSTMVTIISEGKVKFNRSLIYGTKIVNNSIQNHFGVNYEEALRILKDQTLLHPEPEKNDYLGSDVTAAMNQILSGVSRLVDYYTSRNKDGLDKIHIVGGGTRIAGIEAYVKSYFNVDAHIVDSVAHVDSKDETYRVNHCFFANTTGAIFSELNLLPKSVLDREKQREQFRVRMEMGILVLLLIGAAMYLPYLTVKGLREEKASIEAEIAAKQVALVKKAEYEQAMIKLGFYEALDKTTGSTTEHMADVLEALEVNMPSDIDFLSMNNTETGMIISCVATDKLVAVNLIKALKELKVDDQLVFDKVYMPALASTDAEEDEAYYTFSIACEYRLEVASE